MVMIWNEWSEFTETNNIDELDTNKNIMKNIKSIEIHRDTRKWKIQIDRSENKNKQLREQKSHQNKSKKIRPIEGRWYTKKQKNK